MIWNVYHFSRTLLMTIFMLLLTLAINHYEGSFRFTCCHFTFTINEKDILYRTALGLFLP